MIACYEIKLGLGQDISFRLTEHMPLCGLVPLGVSELTNQLTNDTYPDDLKRNYKKTDAESQRLDMSISVAEREIIHKANSA